MTFTIVASGSGQPLPGVDLNMSRDTAEKLVDSLHSALRRDGESQVRFAYTQAPSDTTSVLGARSFGRRR